MGRIVFQGNDDFEFIDSGNGNSDKTLTYYRPGDPLDPNSEPSISTINFKNATIEEVLHPGCGGEDGYIIYTANKVITEDTEVILPETSDLELIANGINVEHVCECEDPLI